MTSSISVAARYGVGLRQHACWDFGFESHRGMHKIILKRVI